jgi:hypothetical protein
MILEKIRPDAYNFIFKTFVTTADENYILARNAFFLEFYTDFFWLSVHSLEKYLKAVLLINGFSSIKNNPGQKEKEYGHDIQYLYRDVKKLIPALDIPPFKNPLSKTDMYWYAETIEQYLEKLTKHGDPNNRYMLYGYNQQQTDLFKVDHLIWHLRWYCKSPTIKIGKKTISTYEEKKVQGNFSHIGSNLPIEKILKDPNKESIKKIFLRMNFSFLPENKDFPRKWQSSSKNPPLSDYCMRIRSKSVKKSDKDLLKDFFFWIIKNIKLSKADKKILTEACQIN